MKDILTSPGEVTRRTGQTGIVWPTDEKRQSERVLVRLYAAIPPVLGLPSWTGAMAAARKLAWIQRRCSDSWTRSALGGIILHLIDLAPEWEFS